jgi:hypothetical protein
MSKLLLAPVIAAAVALGVWLGSGTDASGAGSLGREVVAVRVGDKIQVDGAPLGCRVVRVRELGGRIAVDCRRGGALTGTFGTLVTPNEAALVEFTSARTAKLVFVAKHDGEARKCA